MEPLVSTAAATPWLAAPHVVPTIATAALLALAMVVMAALKGWQGWLALKQRELDMAPRGIMPLAEPDAGPATAARIELADLKERIRKLEAIASGVDL